MIKEVRGYETEDGKFFTLQKDAIEHDAILECCKWYDNSDAEGYLGQGISGQDVAEFLIDNKEYIQEFLKKIN